MSLLDSLINVKITLNNKSKIKIEIIKVLKAVDNPAEEITELIDIVGRMDVGYSHNNPTVHLIGEARIIYKILFKIRNNDSTKGALLKKYDGITGDLISYFPKDAKTPSQQFINSKLARIKGKGSFKAFMSKIEDPFCAIVIYLIYLHYKWLKMSRKLVSKNIDQGSQKSQRSEGAQGSKKSQNSKDSQSAENNSNNIGNSALDMAKYRLKLIGEDKAYFADQILESVEKLRKDFYPLEEVIDNFTILVDDVKNNRIVNDLMLQNQYINLPPKEMYDKISEARRTKFAEREEQVITKIKKVLMQSSDDDMYIEFKEELDAIKKETN